MWVFGAMERLSTLGLIENPYMQITQKAIDLYLKIDENRDILFNKDEHFVSLVKLVCKDAGVIEKIQIDAIVEMMREFKDNRTRIVQFALSTND